MRHLLCSSFLCYTNIYQVFTVQCIGLIRPNNASAARACVNSELWRRDCVQSSFKVYCWCLEVSVTTVLISTPPLCKWYVDTVLWRWVSCFRVNRPAHKELLVVLNAVYLQTVHVRWEKFMKFERKWCTGHGLLALKGNNFNKQPSRHPLCMCRARFTIRPYACTPHMQLGVSRNAC